MWRTFSGTPISASLPDAVAAEIHAIRAASGQVKICVGTDSMVLGSGINFATALVFLVVGNGGYMYIRKHREPRTMPLKERMMTEIAHSVETAFLIDPVVKQFSVPMEIHADINRDERFKSHASYHEAMGYITAMGYPFVSKPDAFASSICADRFC